MSILIEKTKNFDDFAMQRLFQFINLILLVDSNYYHIQELETVKELFSNYKNDYYKQYYPNIVEAAKIAEEIADTTRAGHYDNRYLVSDLHISNVIKTPLHKDFNFNYSIGVQERKNKNEKAGQDLLYFS